jgi:hypothetical protein
VIDAAVQEVGVDLNEARKGLNQAMNHLRSAERCVDNESAFILLYTAAHKALTAVLLSVGLRVTEGERSHVMLLREAKKHLGSEHAELLSRVDRARRKRHDVAYETEEIAEGELKGMQSDVKKTLDAALRFVKEQRQSEASA